MDDKNSQANDVKIVSTTEPELEASDFVEEAVESPSEVTGADQSQAIILTNLESLIKSHISSIDKNMEEFKKQKEMFDSVFENSPVYREHSEKATEANKLKSATRSEISKQPGVISVSAKMKDLRLEMSEMRSDLSEYLQEYQRLTGASTIEDDNGIIRDISISAKLVKRGGK